MWKRRCDYSYMSMAKLGRDDFVMLTTTRLLSRSPSKWMNWCDVYICVVDLFADSTADDSQRVSVFELD